MYQKRCACGFGISDSETTCEACKTKKHISLRNKSISGDIHQLPLFDWFEDVDRKNVIYESENNWCIVDISSWHNK